MAQVCKIMPQEEWDESLGAGKEYVAVSEADLRDGYLHCSSPDQVPGTLAKWYAGMDSVIVVTIDTARLRSVVKWEPNAVGELFPHIYGSIAPEAVADVMNLRRYSTGVLVSLEEGESTSTGATRWFMGGWRNSRTASPKPPFPCGRRPGSSR